MNVFVVYLRRPSNASDNRWDPFWEQGSFGRTGCHSKNLLSKSSRIQPGESHVLFLQGGDACIRAVALAEVSRVTPFTVFGRSGESSHQGHEIRWDRPSGIWGPFVFEKAPLLIDNAGRSDFKDFKRKHLGSTQCRSLVSGAASRFRSRAAPLDPDAAIEVIRVMSTWQGREAKAFHESIPDGSWREQKEASLEAMLAKRRDEYARLKGAKPRSGCR